MDAALRGSVASMSGVSRRLASLLGLFSLAVPAAVAAHCAGYELAAVGQRWLGPLAGDGLHAAHGIGSHGTSLAGTHAGHLPLVPLTTGALFVGAVGMLVLLIGGRRAVGVRAPRLASVLAAQLAVLVAIETAGTISGMSPPVASVLFALALQLPVAVAMVQFARSARRLLVRLLRAAPRPARPAPVLRLVPATLHPRSLRVWAMRPPGRGPPHRWLQHTSAAVTLLS